MRRIFVDQLLRPTAHNHPAALYEASQTFHRGSKTPHNRADAFDTHHHTPRGMPVRRF